VKATINTAGASVVRVKDLAPGTLFSVNSKLSERLFVKCGDGLSTPSYQHGRAGGAKIVGRNSEQPPVWAIIVPTIGVHDNRDDRRAYTPASQKINGETVVTATYGRMTVNG